MLHHVLCVLPHPDDESYVFGGTIAALTAVGHTVSLYTLTRGENSRHALRLGISRDELASRRSMELRQAAEILGISMLIQDDYPDGGLRDIDPRILEKGIMGIIQRTQPHVVLTFDVQGASVHPDHITTHHVVKRVFVEMQETASRLQRLAFGVLPTARISHWPRKVFGAPYERIDIRIPVAHVHEVEKAAIFAHESVSRDVADYNFDNWMLWEEEYYTLFGERFSPPVDSLLHGLS